MGIPPVSPQRPRLIFYKKDHLVRLRIVALCGLLCLLGSEVLAQANQLSFANITARPGEERTIPLTGTFAGGMSGLVMTVLFNPSVIQVLDVSSVT